MSEIIYNPDDVGKDIPNNKGKMQTVRKYHLTISEMRSVREKWLEEVSGLSSKLRNKAGKIFFNPYRKGIYYYQIQTLFLLGANKWHSLSDIITKLEEYTSSIDLRKTVIKEHGYHTAWDQFRGKKSRDEARVSKDYVGRIQENFIMLQRLSRLHPYGYKLHQVHAAIDVKRESRPGFEQGVYYYRLSTYPTMAEALPIKDFSGYDFPKHECKYVSKKFIGTIVTKDKVINNVNMGKIDDKVIESMVSHG
jgi:hypothetical protein